MYVMSTNNGKRLLRVAGSSGRLPPGVVHLEADKRLRV
jgi:hypothetical protein